MTCLKVTFFRVFSFILNVKYPHIRDIHITVNFGQENNDSGPSVLTCIKSNKTSLTKVNICIFPAQLCCGIGLVQAQMPGIGTIACLANGDTVLSHHTKIFSDTVTLSYHFYNFRSSFYASGTMMKNRWVEKATIGRAVFI